MHKYFYVAQLRDPHLPEEKQTLDWESGADADVVVSTINERIGEAMQQGQYDEHVDVELVLHTYELKHSSVEDDNYFGDQPVTPQLPDNFIDIIQPPLVNWRHMRSEQFNKTFDEYLQSGDTVSATMRARNLRLLRDSTGKGRKLLEAELGRAADSIDFEGLDEFIAEFVDEASGDFKAP